MFMMCSIFDPQQKVNSSVVRNLTSSMTQIRTTYFRNRNANSINHSGSTKMISSPTPSWASVMTLERQRGVHADANIAVVGALRLVGLTAAAVRGMATARSDELTSSERDTVRHPVRNMISEMTTTRQMLFGVGQTSLPRSAMTQVLIGPGVMTLSGD